MKQEADQFNKLWKLSCKLYEYFTRFHLLPAKVPIIPEFCFLKYKEPHKYKVLENKIFFVWYLHIHQCNETPYHLENLKWKVMCLPIIST